MSKVKILCPTCSVETVVSVKELEEYKSFICNMCKRNFPVDMTEYERLKSERYNKTHVAFNYLIRNIDFKVKTENESTQDQWFIH